MWLLALLACRHPAPPVAAVEEVSELARSWYLTARVAEERCDVPTALRAWTWLVRLDSTSAIGWAGLARTVEPGALPGVLAGWSAADPSDAGVLAREAVARDLAAVPRRTACPALPSAPGGEE